MGFNLGFKGLRTAWRCS